MLLKLNKETTIELLEKYYKEMGMNGEIKISVTKTQDYFETMDMALVNIVLSGNMNVLGKLTSYEKRLTDKEVKEAIVFVLSNDGYEVSSVDILSGIRKQTTGYGMMETTDFVPYFDGIEVKVKENNKVFQKRGGKYNGKN